MSAPDVEELEALGLYDPRAPDAEERLALIELSLEHGATYDDIRGGDRRTSVARGRRRAHHRAGCGAPDVRRGDRALGRRAGVRPAGVAGAGLRGAGARCGRVLRSRRGALPVLRARWQLRSARRRRSRSRARPVPPWRVSPTARSRVPGRFSRRLSAPKAGRASTSRRPSSPSPSRSSRRCIRCSRRCTGGIS